MTAQIDKRFLFQVFKKKKKKKKKKKERCPALKIPLQSVWMGLKG